MSTHFKPDRLLMPDDATDHILGPASAPVTLVEYGDFECPSCLQAHGAIQIMVSHFGEQLRFVFRHFPLREVHPHAELAAEAAEAAGAQGKFWPMYDLLFTHSQHLKEKHLLDYAGLLELDLILEKFNDRHLASLDAAHVAQFRELLALHDNDLLDLVMGRGPMPDPRFETLLQLLRTP